MGVQSAATTGDSRNCIVACTHGPASSAGLAVHVDWGRNLLIPPLASAASRPAERASVREWQSRVNG